MLKDTLKDILEGTRNVAKKIAVPGGHQPRRRHAYRGERIVVWYGGQKAELPVEAWMRGH